MKIIFRKHPYLYSILILLLLIITAVFLWLSYLSFTTGKQAKKELVKLENYGLVCTLDELVNQNAIIPPTDKNAATYYDRAIDMVKNRSIALDLYKDEILQKDLREFQNTEKINAQKKLRKEKALQAVVYPDYLEHYRSYKPLYLKLLDENQDILPLIKEGNKYPYYVKRTKKSLSYTYCLAPPIQMMHLRKLKELYFIKMLREIDEKKYMAAEETVCECLKFIQNMQDNQYGDFNDFYDTLTFIQMRRSLFHAIHTLIETDQGGSFKRLKQEMSTSIQEEERQKQKMLLTSVALTLDEKIPKPQITGDKKNDDEERILYYLRKFLPKFIKNKGKTLSLRSANIIMDFQNGKISREEAYGQTEEIRIKLWRQSGLLNELLPLLLTINGQHLYNIYQYMASEDSQNQWQELYERIPD